MTSFLAIIGLVVLIMGGIALGWFAGIANVFRRVVSYPQRGIVVTAINHRNRTVSFVADQNSCHYFARFGTVSLVYRDSRTGDMHWVLDVSRLQAWEDALVAALQYVDLDNTPVLVVSGNPPSRAIVRTSKGLDKLGRQE